MKFLSTTALALTAASSVIAVPNGFNAHCKSNPGYLHQQKLPEAASGYTATWKLPGSDLQLARVVIGYGTQNYTCASSTAAPKAIGAKAHLYDFTRAARCMPPAMFDAMFHTIPALVYGAKGGLDTITGLIRPTAKKAGSHIFPDSSTPVFTFFPKRGTGSGPADEFVGKKVSETAAPATAVQGEFGAVPWLELGLKEPAKGHRYNKVYRVMTAGGKPPAICQGRDDTFEIKYAAEYWFYEERPFGTLTTDEEEPSVGYGYGFD